MGVKAASAPAPRSATIILHNAPPGMENALGPEIGFNTDRCVVSCKREGDKLTLTITTPDTTALRSALGSHLRWISCNLSVEREVSGHGHA